ncbi:S8 family peptidase, partial [Brevundimonas sp.]|uniref:S8 family peptidase n=1 Tax=Brevundimonas sp. TaxID=1871086 RepID=UPI002FCBCD95
MPDITTREYTRNWGLAETKALSAWQTGATGKGVTVAVIDSGMTANHPDLAANVSSASTDIVIGRNTLESPDRHGTRVASVIAAPHNGRGTIGVAYESSILAIRADVSECTKPEDDVCFKSSDLARALDYAVANGARIINMSLGGEGSMGLTFEQALLRAVNAGAIIAISSGNEGEVNPSWPGRYATDPRFAGSIIVVGSHGLSCCMSSFSNRAGVNQTAYISAPGEKVVADCDDTSCWEISGTSFSSPAVAGAMALLKQAFPNLTGRDIVDILLTSAADAGDTGTDIVWGRGKLDIQRAFQPIGRTSSPRATSATAIGLDVPPG